MHLGSDAIALTIDDARSLADTLENVAENQKTVGLVLESTFGLLVIRRRGPGVSLEPKPDGSARHVLTTVLARDLARQIRKAAAANK